MSRRRHDRHPLGRGVARQRSNRHALHTSRHAPSPVESAAENPLIRVLRPALGSDDPSAFWVAAAPLVTELANLEHQAEVLPEGVDLLDTFLEINVAETTALLHMVAAMSPDEGLRSRAQVGLTARRQPMRRCVSGPRGRSAGTTSGGQCSGRSVARTERCARRRAPGHGLGSPFGVSQCRHRSPSSRWPPITESITFVDGAGENMLVELVAAGLDSAVTVQAITERVPDRHDGWR